MLQNTRRVSIGAAAVLSPSGVLGPVILPPCRRHRFLARHAGARHGRPERQPVAPPRTEGNRVRDAPSTSRIETRAGAEGHDTEDTDSPLGRLWFPVSPFRVAPGREPWLGAIARIRRTPPIGSRSAGHRFKARSRNPRSLVLAPEARMCKAACPRRALLHSAGEANQKLTDYRYTVIFRKSAGSGS